MIFLLFTLNILILFTVRVLIKRNIYINSLGYLTVFLQMITLIISVVRKRNFVEVPFEIPFFFFGVSFSLIFLLPIVIEKFLSKEKKLQLQTIENNIKIFLLEIFHDFLEKYILIAKFCNFFSTKLTIIAIKLAVSKYLWVILITPWLIFFYFFIIEILTQNFLFSPYLLAYWLFFYRIFVLFFYIAKNTQASYFISPLRNKIRSFWPVELYLNFKTLVDLVLPHESLNKDEKIKNWKNFNEFLSPFIDFSILNDLFYHQLSYFKKTIDTLNFVVIFSGLVFLILNKYFGLNEFIFFICFFFLSGYFLFYFYDVQEETLLEKNYKDFFKGIMDFLCHFKFVLIQDHLFNRRETDDNFKLPIRLEFSINFKNFFPTFFVSLWIFLSVFYFFVIFFDLLFYFINYLPFECLILEYFFRF